LRFVVKNLPYLIQSPDKELALLALAVGILGGVKAAARCLSMG
jgi:hypothetical protein